MELRNKINDMMKYNTNKLIGKNVFAKIRHTMHDDSNGKTLEEILFGLPRHITIPSIDKLITQ